ncbi:hypothetical protein HMPREF1068_04287 [Bacteroides nordii CL02T12C05]|uniref:Uncharacterized protein n=1 Tax=Bacteroides nordii CL02T12C05 TaxID=997884 RepID=I8WZQ4_9BACE|nr:hypothetical protein HMPREF1068_04287 [Bacteroides nordii CL02T12C05]
MIVCMTPLWVLLLITLVAKNCKYPINYPLFIGYLLYINEAFY